MPFAQNVVITIKFAEAAPFVGNAKPDRVLMSREIRLVERVVESARSFTLFDGDAPEYTLSVEETEHLDQFLGHIEVKAPWKGQAGFDGTDYELILLGAMSSLVFRWWVQVPAEWKHVGEAFDYILALADRYQGE